MRNSKLPGLTLLAAALAVTAGCAEQTVPSSQENQDLDEAANLLDHAPQNLSGIDDSELGESNLQEAQQ